MADYAPKLKKILTGHGCKRIRQGKGDHEFWESPISGNRFPVDHKIQSRHTANAVLKQAGIPEKFR